MINILAYWQQASDNTEIPLYAILRAIEGF